MRRQLRVHLRFLVVVAVVSVVGCSRCQRDPVVTPAVPAPSPVLTEQDTEPHDGGLRGPDWALTLDGTWLAVKASSQQRLKPGLQAWALDPDGPVQVTVECQAPTVGVEKSLKTDLDATRVTQKLEDVSFSTLSAGPWLEGALATWKTAEAHHVLGRFRTLGSRCDVHGWGPVAQGVALRERLRAVILNFGSNRPALVAELAALTSWLQANEAAQLKLAAVRDAGYSPLSGVLLMDKALVRLGPEQLVERFKLRAQLLAALGPTECAQVVRHRVEESPRMLELISEAEAVRWVSLTREALSLAVAADGPPVLPTKREVEEAISALAAGDEELITAIEVLRNGDTQPDEAVCEAEKMRLAKVLQQPSERRILLLRSLLEN